MGSFLDSDPKLWRDIAWSLYVAADEYSKELAKLLKQIGSFTGEPSRPELIREFFNRLHSSVVSLQNALLAKDALHAALVQRYNFELITDFFYLLSPGGEEDKMEKFFNFPERSNNEKEREWSNYSQKEKRAFLPLEGLDKHYKILSTVAHPNLLSIQVSRRGEEHEYFVISGAILSAMTGINVCLTHESFIEEFSNIDLISSLDNLMEITSRASAIRAMK
jgi:hypothetical protein